MGAIASASAAECVFITVGGTARGAATLTGDTARDVTVDGCDSALADSDGSDAFLAPAACS